MSNAASRVRARQFSNAPGNPTQGLLNLVLILLGDIDNDGSETNDVDNVLSQLRSYDGKSLAVQWIGQQLNPQRDKTARR